MNKNIVTSFLLIIGSILACESGTDNPEKNIVNNFIENVISLEEDTNKNPIASFKIMANTMADEKIVFSKGNIDNVLIRAKDFKHCVISVENHTLVKIENIDDCQQSGSWKTCMPTVKGYIKKGELNYKDDFMNNVIGTPDNQERIAYFFEKFDRSSEQSDYNIELNDIKFDLSKLNFKSNSINSIKKEYNKIEQELENYKEYSLFENGLIDPKKVMVDYDEEGMHVLQFYYVENDDKVILEGDLNSYISCYFDKENNLRKVDFTSSSHDHQNVKSYYFLKGSKLPFFYSYDTWVMHMRSLTRLYFKEENQSLLTLKTHYASNDYYDESDNEDYLSSPEDLNELRVKELNYEETIGLLNQVSSDIKLLQAPEIIESNSFYYQDYKMSEKMREEFYENGFKMINYYIKNIQDNEESPNYIDTTRKYFFSSMSSDSAYSLFKFYCKKCYNINGIFPSINDIILEDNMFSISNPIDQIEGNQSKFSIYASQSTMIDSIVLYNIDGFQEDYNISLISNGENWKLIDYKRFRPFYECGL